MLLIAPFLRDDIDEEAHPTGIIIHGSVPDNKGQTKRGEDEEREASEGEGDAQGGSADDDDDDDVMLVTEDEWVTADGGNHDIRKEKRKRTGDEAGMIVTKKGRSEEIVLLD